MPTLLPKLMSLYNFLSAFSFISIGSALIPIVMYFLTDRQNKEARYVLLLLFSSLIADVSNEAYYRLGMRGYEIVNTFYVVQFTLLCLIYSSMLINKKLVIFIWISFLITFIVYSISFQPIHEYQSFIRVIGGVVIIFLAIWFFVELLRTLPTDDILTYFPMWINCAVMFYFAFNLFLFASANYMFKNEPQEISMASWGFHNFNNIVKNCLFAGGLYVCFVKKRKTE
jgi:hypothetical protein